MYIRNVTSARQLEIDAVIETADRLRERVAYRFPGRSIDAVACELADVAIATKVRASSIARPQWLVRVAALVVAGAALALLGRSAILILDQQEASSRANQTQSTNSGKGVDGSEKSEFEVAQDALQLAQAALQDLVFLGLGGLFLIGLEGRVKRKKALAGLDELRSFAHVIDMHQLTKDPEAVLNPYLPTPSSPVRTTDRFELTRYLEYCSEMLALTNKLAAVYAQGCQDAVVLGGVRDIQDLVGMLSAKIWQKIVIVDTAAGVRQRNEATGQAPEQH